MGADLNEYPRDVTILQRHPKALTLLSYAIAAGAVIAIAAVWGAHAFIRAWAHPHPGWLIAAAGGAMAALLAYVLAYWALMRVDDGPGLSIELTLKIVALGFGPFVPGGGFHVDKRALKAVHGDGVQAGATVFAIGLLELAVLSPAACACAVILLADRDPRPMASNLWPWVVLVPAVFVLGIATVVALHRRGVDPYRSGIRGVIARAVSGGWMLIELVRRPRLGCPALLAMAAYWVCDITSFYAAVRFIGLDMNIEEVILAYATGYALTRRALPFGGAGITDALLTFAIHWVGQPIPAALAVVVVYRVFNFAFPALPALLAHRRVTPLVADGELREADAAHH